LFVYNHHGYTIPRSGIILTEVSSSINFTLVWVFDGYWRDGTGLDGLRERSNFAELLTTFTWL